MLRAVFATFAVCVICAPLAAGHPHPAGCTQSAFDFDFGPGLNIVHRNGDVVQINAQVSNDHLASGVCDVTNATVRLTFPHANGTPDGQEFTLATGVNFPANAPMKSFGKRTLTVGFDPGVFRGYVYIYAGGVVHGSADDYVSESGLGRPLVISRPHTTLEVTPTPSGGPPFTITYTYTVENDSDSDPAGEISNPTPDVGAPNLVDDRCSPVEFVGGDTVAEEPKTLTHGETWTFTCTRSFPAGSLVSTARFTGGSTRDGRPWPANAVRTAYCGRLEATIVGTNRKNTINGTPGPDVIVGMGGDDVINGLGGADIICGGDGNDTLRGGNGADTLRGERGRDRLVGGAGADTIIQ